MSKGPDYFGTTPLGEIFRARSECMGVFTMSANSPSASVGAPGAQASAAQARLDAQPPPEMYNAPSDDSEDDDGGQPRGDTEYENMPKVDYGDQAGAGQPAQIPGSNNLFVRMVNALSEPASLPAILAVSTLKSTDFTVFKTRQLFMAAGGIPALIRIISTMSFSLNQPGGAGSDDASGVVKADPKLGYEALFVLATLAEIAPDTRRTIVEDEGVPAAMRLVGAAFAPNVTFAAGIRARALRMIAGCALRATCRQQIRRMDGVALLLKHMRQALREYVAAPSPDAGSILCGLAFAIDNLVASARCREALRAANGIHTLVSVVSDVPIAFQMTDDIVKLTANEARQGSPQDFVFEAVTNALRTLSESKGGRSDIHQHGGIPKVCMLLQKTQSTRVRQRAVGILANCAQDPGVDSAVRKAGGLAVLASLLASKDVDTLLSACRTIVLVCRKGPYFGSHDASMLYNVEQGYLSFNARNDDNILELCRQKAVAGLASHIDVPLDVLGVSDRPAKSLIVTATVGADDGIVSVQAAHAARTLVLTATQALAPLLSCRDGRAALKGNKPLFAALLSHVNVADPDVIVATTFALSIAADGDPDTCKQIVAADGLRKVWSLLRHPNLLVLTAAARCLVPLLRDTTKALLVGRTMSGAMDQLSILLHNPCVLDSSTDGIANPAYRAYLTLECKAWLVGMVAELAKDPENAKVLSEYGVLPVICSLVREHAVTSMPVEHPYEFAVQNRMREKCALALASISTVGDNKNAIALSGALPAFVLFVANREGEAVFDTTALPPSKVLGGPVPECPTLFGSHINFSEEPVSVVSANGVDVDPQATANPYLVVNRSAAIAMAELSKNKLCAMILRQNGAVYGLLTLIGSSDLQSQTAAAQAVQNIRRHHIQAIAAFTRRCDAEMATVHKDLAVDGVVAVEYLQRQSAQLYANVDGASELASSRTRDQERFGLLSGEAARALDSGLGPYGDPDGQRTDESLLSKTKVVSKGGQGLNSTAAMQYSVLTAPSFDNMPKVAQKPFASQLGVASAVNGEGFRGASPSRAQNVKEPQDLNDDFESIQQDMADIVVTANPGH